MVVPFKTIWVFPLDFHGEHKLSFFGFNMTILYHASIQRIKDLSSIEGADRIEVATINCWKVVVQKRLYTVGDLVCYLEIDSWVPHDIKEKGLN